jgi:hypothetical protein
MPVLRNYALNSVQIREQFVIMFIVIMMTVMTITVTASSSNSVEAILFLFRCDGLWSFHLSFGQ